MERRSDMPLLQDPILVSSLRQRHPVLTHTSWQKLDEIQPRKNVDTYLQDERKIVCATSDPLQRDFYALRCNENSEMINHAISFSQNGIQNKVFIFEKMKDRYFEHEVSSEYFTPVVAPDGKTFASGEWIAETCIFSLNVKEGTKECVLKRTRAGIYLIVNKEQYLEERRQPENWQKLKNSNTALSVIENMVRHGILKCEKFPQREYLNLLSLSR